MTYERHGCWRLRLRHRNADDSYVDVTSDRATVMTTAAASLSAAICRVRAAISGGYQQRKEPSSPNFTANVAVSRNLSAAL